MRLRFADCSLDAEARQLWRGGRPVAVPSRAWQLLVLLLEHRPRALSQARLRDALWPDTHVGYASLAQLVTQVRRAIGDTSRPPRLVRTVPRFGYAFVAEVSEETPRADPRFAGAFVAAGREYPVPEGETLVGRGAVCGVRLLSRQVSRVHARVVAGDGGVTIEDAGSKNGTWVNGTRREGPASLVPDDEVSLGGFRMVFHGPGAGSSTRTGGPQ
jgi:DNA-binding winged helix-turn-helix (wHTH) protein